MSYCPKLTLLIQTVPDCRVQLITDRVHLRFHAVGIDKLSILTTHHDVFAIIARVYLRNKGLG